MIKKCAICGKSISYSGHWKDYIYKTKVNNIALFTCSDKCNQQAQEYRGHIQVPMEPLERARNTYGNKNQISVVMEELNELAAALAKYVRYSSHERALCKTQDKVLDEVADVYIVLEHVKAIYRLRTGVINKRIEGKIERLIRWMDTDDSMEQTTIDREVNS